MTKTKTVKFIAYTPFYDQEANMIAQIDYEDEEELYDRINSIGDQWALSNAGDCYDYELLRTHDMTEEAYYEGCGFDYIIED